jgi:hypothetical protein
MEAYRVAIALALNSNHAAVLSALSSNLLGVHAQVDRLHGGFSVLQKLIPGALAIGAGLALLKTMVSIVEKTKDYSDELVKLQRLGGAMAPAVASGAMSRQAFDIAQRVPMSVTDLLKIPGSLYSIVGQEEAMKLWEPVAKLSWVLQSQKDYTGNPGDDINKIIRGGELSGRITDPTTGQIDPERLQKYLDLVTKITAATHGMVNPSSILGMAQQGGFALRGLSDEGFMSMAIAAQAMGGQRAGTALLSMWQQMAGGTMFTRTAEGLQDLGLLKQGEWHTDHGRVILGDDASRRLTGLLGKDPLDLVAKIDENLKAQGVTDPEERARKVMRAFGRQTTQRLSTEELNNYQQIIAERGRLSGGAGIGGSMDLINNGSVTANMVALQNAWTNFLTALAGPNGQNVISGLQFLTGSLNSITKAITAMNPDTLKNLGIGLLALSAALVVGGAAVLALSPAGWLVLGIGALGAACVAFNSQITSGLDAVRDYFLHLQQRIVGPINGMSGTIFNALKSLWDKLMALFKGASGPGADQFKRDLDAAPYTPMRFDPGTGAAKAQPVRLTLKLDGRPLAHSDVELPAPNLFQFPSGNPLRAA